MQMALMQRKKTHVNVCGDSAHNLHTANVFACVSKYTEIYIQLKLFFRADFRARWYSRLSTVSEIALHSVTNMERERERENK